MANEVSFRNAINGFNKADVMDYIEGLLQKENKSVGVEALLRSKTAELQSQLSKAAQEKERLSKEKDESASELQNCRIALEKAQSARQEAEEALRNLKAEFENYKTERTDEVSADRQTDKADNAMPDIACVIPDACTNCDKAKLYEAQLGAAMLDAKRFSEILVKEANDKVSRLLDSAGECALDTAKKAQFIADDVKRLTNNFNAVYTQLYKQMSTLVENLDGFAREAGVSGNNYSYHTEFVPENSNGSF